MGPCRFLWGHIRPLWAHISDFWLSFACFGFNTEILRRFLDDSACFCVKKFKNTALRPITLRFNKTSPTYSQNTEKSPLIGSLKGSPCGSPRGAPCGGPCCYSKMPLGIPWLPQPLESFPESFQRDSQRGSRSIPESFQKATESFPRAGQ